MASASIGIKLADGSFFPVMEEGAPAAKLLELTTVRDDQTSVQINLFRSETGTIDDAGYVGSLIIEDIQSKPAGDATIELTLKLDDQNDLSAEAVDLDSGFRQVLHVSLETLDNESVYSVPDFDLTPMTDSLHPGVRADQDMQIMTGTIPGNAPEGLYDMENEKTERKACPLPPWLCVALFVIGVAALVLAMIISARAMLLQQSVVQESASSPVAVAPVEPVPAPEPDPVPVEEEVPPPPVTAPAEDIAPVTAVETPVVPATPEPAAVTSNIRYRIKWGDTLWDISEAYYRNPWLYTKIATYNKIRNPNLIISGTYIIIPAQ